MHKGCVTQKAVTKGKEVMLLQMRCLIVCGGDTIFLCVNHTEVFGVEGGPDIKAPRTWIVSPDAFSHQNNFFFGLCGLRCTKHVRGRFSSGTGHLFGDGWRGEHTARAAATPRHSEFKRSCDPPPQQVCFGVWRRCLRVPLQHHGGMGSWAGEAKPGV